LLAGFLKQWHTLVIGYHEPMALEKKKSYGWVNATGKQPAGRPETSSRDIERARDTERLAQPNCRPDPPVLRNETELHVDSFAK
jgi:hypothetical protein